MPQPRAGVFARSAGGARDGPAVVPAAAAAESAAAGVGAHALASALAGAAAAAAILTTWSGGVAVPTAGHASWRERLSRRRGALFMATRGKFGGATWGGTSSQIFKISESYM